MKILFVAFIIALLNVVSANNFIRKEHQIPLNGLQQSFHRAGKKFHQGKVGLSNAISFPANPTYVVAQAYASGSCGGYLGGFSALVGTCLQSATTSVIYSCGVDNTLTSTTYTDTACSIGAQSATHNVHDCIPDYDNGGTVKIVACGTTDPWDYTLASVIPTYYQNNVCSATQVVGTTALANGLCVDNNDGTSTKFSWPNILYYQFSTTCSGSHYTVPIPINCTSTTNTDDEIEYSTYTEYQHVSSGFSNLTMGLFALFSAMFVAVGLWKN